MLDFAHRLRDDPDVASGRREFHGVVEQVHEDLRQTDRVGFQPDRFVGQRDRQDVMGGVDERLAELHGVGDDRARVRAAPGGVRPCPE